MAAPVKVAKQQTTPELPNPASGTYTLGNPPERSETVRNPPFGNFRNLPPKPTHTPEPCGTFRNLPPEPTPFYTGTLRNLLEPAPGTYTSTHRNSPELSGTFLGTCSCNPHRYTPELIWAEDPISLRCWGIKDGQEVVLAQKTQWKHGKECVGMTKTCCHRFQNNENNAARGPCIHSCPCVHVPSVCFFVHAFKRNT